MARSFQLCFLVLICLAFFESAGQCVESRFVVNGQSLASVCPGQPLEIENDSEHAIRYEWDFCAGDLEGTPTGTLVTTLTAVQTFDAIKIIKESATQFFGFVVKQASGGLFRLDFGSDLSSIPTVEHLGSFGLTNAAAIEFIKDNDTWYALVASGSNLVRIKFSDGLGGEPASIASTNLGSFSGLLSSVRGLALVKEGADFLALATSSSLNTITVLRFEGAMEGSVSTHSVAVPGSAQLMAIHVFKDCDVWYGVMTSVGNNRLIKASFGNDLTNTAAYEFRIQSGVSVQSFGMDVIVENSNYHVFLASILNPSTLYQLNFGTSIWTNNPVVTNRGSLSGLAGVIAMDFVQEDSEVVGFLGNRSNYQLHRITYPNSCSANISTSSLPEPENIAYSNTGTFSIELKAYDTDGNFVATSRSLEVYSPPEVDFAFDQNCLNSNTLFYDKTIPGQNEIVAWTWDIGGLAGSDLQNPTFEFSAAADYNVKLQVEDAAGCVRISEKVVKVYSDQDIAVDFSYPDLFCSNSIIDFQDESTFLEDKIVSWRWDFNHGEASYDVQDPDYIFEASGPNHVALHVTGTSGCTYSMTKEIDAVEGPVLSFGLEDNYCVNETIKLEASSVNEVKDISWDFGDGGSVEGREAAYSYTLPGVFNVVLSGEAANGCKGVHMQEVHVRNNPQADFSIDAPPLSCSGNPTPFTDISLNADGVLEHWLWHFNGSDFSDLQNPEYTFDSEGSHDVSLTVTNEYGCEHTIEKSVAIAPTPAIQIAHNAACANVPVSFTPPSDPAITNVYWEIGTAYYHSASPTHTFRTAGTFPIYLEATADNGCVATLREAIRVPVPLTPDFTVIKNCINQETIFTDITSGLDPIVGREWLLNGHEPFGGSPVKHTFIQQGDQHLTLAVTTAAGCSYQVTKQFPVVAQPAALFSADPDAGAWPLEVAFTNTSSAATGYRWEFQDGSATTSTDISPVHTFTREGSFDVVLTAFNQYDCEDVFTSAIEVVAPLPDADVEVITLSPNPDGSAKLIVTIHNKGNTILRNVPLDIDFSGDLSLRQTLDQPVLPGTKHNMVFHTGIINLEALRYLCVTLDVQNDLTPAGNRRCKEMEKALLLFPCYPNPTASALQIEWISGASARVRISLADAVGRSIFSHEISASPGLNVHPMDVSGLQEGIYHLTLEDPTARRHQRIVVSRPR